MNKRSTRYVAAGSLTAVIVALALAPFNLGGCAGGGSVNNLNVTNLVQGGNQVGHSFTLSEKDEPALGQAVAVQATNRWPLYHDQALTRYVTLVGRTVGASSSRPDIKYYFGILDTEEVNAFSGPRGYILITRGALMRMQNEAELAGVLGHEIGHVCKHHGLDAAKKANFVQGTEKLASGADSRIAAFGSASDAATDLALNVGCSEPQEMEADHEGVKFATNAGYDPDAYLHFLQRLVVEQGAGGKPFGTHPGMGDRVKKVAAQIDKAGTGGQGQLLADRFKQNVIFK